jgi:type I restriction enzyme, S subunit
MLSSNRVFEQKREPAVADDEQLSVTQKYGVMPQSLFMAMDDRKVTLALAGTDNFKHVDEGDFVISLRSFEGGIELSHYNGCISPAYTCLRARKPIGGGYYKFTMKSKDFISALQSVTQGIRDGKNISYAEFSKLSIPYPPVEEQAAIARFLDRETAKIDALIAEQQRLIELLQEKRQAVISNAVTKGLNPNAPMKDSGVEWLGEVPEHWGVRRLRHIGTVQNGLNISGEAFGEGDPFISYGDVYKNPNVPQKPAGLVRSAPEDKQKYGLERGDVLFTRTSETIDDIGVASTCLEQIPHSTFAGFLIRLRPFKGVLEPRYSTHLFRNQGVKTHFAGTMNMVTRASLSQGELGNLAICLPPLDEQLMISSAIEEMAGQSDQLISSAWKLVALLQERRSALISAAVTGQIDVRKLAEVEGIEQ